MAAFKSGFVSIIGSPNAGKSTIMNAFVGQKVSIVSSKAQTTRNRVLGVLTRKTHQIVFIDTPGIITPKNKLGEYMLKVAYESINEVEVILFIIDASKGIGARDEAIIQRLKKAKAPIIAVINKIDIASMADVDVINARLDTEGIFKERVRLSALMGDGLDRLEQTILGHFEQGPMYFPEDMVTDVPERVICGEFIREKALGLLKQEIPHGIGVYIDKMSQRDDGIFDIWATIYCERDSHKGIIIGKQGSMLKRIGSEARHEMEWMLGTKVNLTLWVKVKSDWRNSLGIMTELGYSEK